MVKIPTEENRQRVVTLLEDFIKLLESHSGWTPPRPNAALFHVWDFVKRSQYIATELDNIRQGKPVAFPDQIPSYNKPVDKEEKAQMCWTDVITRTLTINQIIQKPLPLAFMGSGIIDFGDEIRNRSKEVQEEILSLPE